MEPAEILRRTKEMLKLARCVVILPNIHCTSIEEKNKFYYLMIFLACAEGFLCNTLFG